MTEQGASREGGSEEGGNGKVRAGKAGSEQRRAGVRTANSTASRQRYPRSNQRPPSPRSSIPDHRRLGSVSKREPSPSVAVLFNQATRPRKQARTKPRRRCALQSESELLRQAEDREQADLPEGNDPRDTTAPDREHLKVVRLIGPVVPAIRGQRRLPVRRGRYVSPGGRIVEDAARVERCNRVASGEPRRDRRHLQRGLLSQQLHQRGHVTVLQSRHVAREKRPQ